MAAKKCRVILFLPPKAVQDIYPAIKWFFNHFIKKQYYNKCRTFSAVPNCFPSCGSFFDYCAKKAFALSL